WRALTLPPLTHQAQARILEGIALVVDRAPGQFRKAQFFVEAHGLRVLGIDFERELAPERQGMGDKTPADAQALPVRRHEQAADKVVEQADEAGRLAAQAGDPGFGAR